MLHAFTCLHSEVTICKNFHLEVVYLTKNQKQSKKTFSYKAILRLSIFYETLRFWVEKWLKLAKAQGQRYQQVYLAHSYLIFAWSLPLSTKSIKKLIRNRV